MKLNKTIGELVIERYLPFGRNVEAKQVELSGDEWNSMVIVNVAIDPLFSSFRLGAIALGDDDEYPFGKFLAVTKGDGSIVPHYVFMRDFDIKDGLPFVLNTGFIIDVGPRAIRKTERSYA